MPLGGVPEPASQCTTATVSGRPSPSRSPGACLATVVPAPPHSRGTPPGPGPERPGVRPAGSWAAARGPWRWRWPYRAGAARPRRRRPPWPRPWRASAPASWRCARGPGARRSARGVSPCGSWEPGEGVGAPPRGGQHRATPHTPGERRGVRRFHRGGAWGGNEKAPPPSSPVGRGTRRRRRFVGRISRGRRRSLRGSGCPDRRSPRRRRPWRGGGGAAAAPRRPRAGGR